MPHLIHLISAVSSFEAVAFEDCTCLRYQSETVFQSLIAWIYRLKRSSCTEEQPCYIQKVVLQHGRQHNSTHCNPRLLSHVLKILADVTFAISTKTAKFNPAQTFLAIQYTVCKCRKKTNLHCWLGRHEPDFLFVGGFGVPKITTF